MRFIFFLFWLLRNLKDNLFILFVFCLYLMGFKLPEENDLFFLLFSLPQLHSLHDTCVIENMIWYVLIKRTENTYEGIYTHTNETDAHTNIGCVTLTTHIQYIRCLFLYVYFIPQPIWMMCLTNIVQKWHVGGRCS